MYLNNFIKNQIFYFISILFDTNTYYYNYYLLIIGFVNIYYNITNKTLINFFKLVYKTIFFKQYNQISNIILYINFILF